MRCKDAEKNLILYYYAEIDSSAEAELRGHLETCSKCMSSWESLKSTLDAIGTKEPELPESFWQRYLSKVYDRIEDKKSLGHFRLFKPRFVQVAAIVLLLLFVGFGGLKLYESKQEDAFITQNYELIKDIELLEELEILEHLEEIDDV